MAKFLELFATAQDDGYGGTTYEMTNLGNTALVILALIILIFGSAIMSRKNEKEGKGKTSFNTKQMAFSAMAMALAFITSYMKLFALPMDGSAKLFTMFFIAVVGWWYGPRTGITVGITFGILKLIVDPYIISFPQMMLDYVFAYGALGMSGFLKNSKFGVIPGYSLGVLMRFLCAFLSGWIFFGQYAGDYGFSSAALYSACYNGLYIGAEYVLTVVVLLIPAVRKAMETVRKDAVSG